MVSKLLKFAFVKQLSVFPPSQLAVCQLASVLICLEEASGGWKLDSVSLKTIYAV